MRAFWSKSVLTAAAALACLGSANAAVITFEDPVDGFFFNSGDVIAQGGFRFTPMTVDHYDTGVPEDGGVGVLIDGADAGSCGNMVCPTNNATHYLGAVNDGIIKVTAGDGGAFALNGFSASFLGADGEAITFPAGILRVLATRANGSYTLAQFELGGPLNGSLQFADYVAGSAVYPSGFGSVGTLATANFVELAFFGFVCNATTGSCNGFTTNRGQFALDNMNLVSAVPEPAHALLMGLGLAAVGATVRRRRAAAAAV